ncbi:MATE family efflux transporter [Amycolatopsis sp. NBC_00345]|uniref:MATE family efflux transporter n=1 Tax=Amycolatopsis sp. NBC_00345 TaxID=2975955 RepID=UPI002E264B99
MRSEKLTGKLRLWALVGKPAAALALAELTDVLVLLGIVRIMGAMGGSALYVRSLYQPVDLSMIAVTGAFAISNQVSAAISRGRKRPGDVFAAAGSLARVWLVSGALLCLALSVAAPGLADLAHVETLQREDFISFLRWTLSAGLLGFGPALTASCLRGYGHTRGAIIVTMSASLINIGGVAVLGLVARIGIAAIPIASATASVAGLAIGLIVLRRTELWHPASVRVWQADVLRHLRRIGIPVAGSVLLVAVYNMAMLTTISSFGPDAVAGFSVAAAAQNLLFLPGMMLGAATAILINQQRGAGEHAQMGRTLRSGLELGTCAYVVVAVAVWLAGGSYAHLMNSEAGIAHQTAAFLTTVGLTYAVQGPVLLSLTVMEHTEGGRLAVVLNVVYFALVVVIARLATDQLGDVSAVYGTVAVCNLIGVVIPAIAVRHVRRLSRRTAVNAASVAV